MKFADKTATAIITFAPDKILPIERHPVPFKEYWGFLRQKRLVLFKFSI